MRPRIACARRSRNYLGGKDVSRLAGTARKAWTAGTSVLGTQRMHWRCVCAFVAMATLWRCRSQPNRACITQFTKVHGLVFVRKGTISLLADFVRFETFVIEASESRVFARPWLRRVCEPPRRNQRRCGVTSNAKPSAVMRFPSGSVVIPLDSRLDELQSGCGPLIG